MTTRYRWIKAEWPISIRNLAERLKFHVFSESVSEGFVVDRAREDFLQARFIEKINIVEKIVDPFGNDLLFERTEYKQTTFRAWNDWPGLELTNASRSVQNLLSQLTEINDFKVVFAPLKIDVVKWADTFQSKIETTAIVDSIQIGSLLLEEGVTAKVVIRSDTDVRNAYLKLTQDRKFSLQKIQLLIKGSHSSHVVLSNDGTARIDTSGSDENLVIALRASIQNVI